MKMSKSALQAQQAYTENEKDLATAEAELKRLVKKGRDQKDTELIGSAYFFLGVCCYDRGDWVGMYTNAYKAVAFLKDTKDYYMATKAYDLLGYTYEQQENFIMQLDVYEMAYKLIRKHRLGDILYRTSLNNLASCYHHIGDCKTAIKRQEECLSLHKRISADDYTRTTMYTINLAEYYYDDGEPQKAMEILESIEGILGKTTYKPYVYDYYLKRAICSFYLDMPEKVAEYVEKALLYTEAGIYPHQIYDDLRRVSHCALECGRSDLASRIISLMKTYAAEKPEVTEQLIAYRTMAEYYARTNAEKQALSCYAKLEELQEKKRMELNRAQFNSRKKESRAEAEIQKLKRMLSKTEGLACVDPLSGLLNRSALLRVASDFIEVAARKKEMIGAIFIDIDHFKQCNDTYGHAKGDDIIREVARACKKVEAQNIRFARYGGDEFFGITRGLNDDQVIDIAKQICERIRKANIPNIGNPNGHRVTLSVGIANVLIVGQVDTIIEIANYADKALPRKEYGQGQDMRACSREKGWIERRRSVCDIPLLKGYDTMSDLKCYFG